MLRLKKMTVSLKSKDGCMMYSEKEEKEFQELLQAFKADEALMEHMQSVSFEDLFSYKFLAENSDFSSLDDILFRSGFGLMSPMEIANVPSDKWDEYIAQHTDKCDKWHDFGKLAMIEWMKNILQEKGN